MDKTQYDRGRLATGKQNTNEYSDIIDNGTTRSSAVAEGPRDALCQLKTWKLALNFSTAIQKEIRFGKVCHRWMTLKVAEGHPNYRYLIGYNISLLNSDICSNNDSFL